MAIQEKFDECYSIEDNQKALACLKEMVKHSSGSCRPKLVLLTQKNCVPCSEEKTLRKPDIASGVIQEVNIDSSEGLEIIAKNGIDNVPALLFLDCNNNLINPSV
ncbi:hypothetical protein LCGC14_0654890 [marine sediment metagenome]|uniref:Thioredoxin-like fold domain-containing protein n=1 Tax=marine sediment metagenome TaxID=412755 RepID=A0A0F9RF47_9ZZZZ